MVVNLMKLLSACENETPKIKKIVSDSVCQYKQTRDAEQIKKLVQQLQNKGLNLQNIIKEEKE